MDSKKLYPLNDGWLLIDGNACGSASFHACGIPAENAAKADLPSFTHMYIPDHVGISWYEKTFSLSTLPEPDETDAIAFSTGYPNDRGYIGGFKLGTYCLGAGALTLSAFALLDRADSVPYAARLLVNLLENA